MTLKRCIHTRFTGVPILGFNFARLVNHQPVFYNTHRGYTVRVWQMGWLTSEMNKMFSPAFGRDSSQISCFNTNDISGIVAPNNMRAVVPKAIRISMDGGKKYKRS